jgi:hypothetical protein
MSPGADDLNKRGLYDALAALAGILKNISNAEHRAEARAGEAESELVSLRSLRGFVDLEIEIHRARLRAIEAQENPEKPSS